ncbi:glycosyltransferase family 39 protein [Streptomyces mangrovisoli]|uniref:Glycosyltransferase RgtA/B/C/D-like domain-containing protein n=1 Tax=Streptomyces mangrovisoli TaxID=1428628 RepID=A0A1J4NMK7_9ACTN|nr:glycosyltransferase family 39 protein [Streptomyces mangrovisoli]OIJ63649.1 hypothetical protein WN71_033060 [Streptomyces mangrovisoli]
MPTLSARSGTDDHITAFTKAPFAPVGRGRHPVPLLVRWLPCLAALGFGLWDPTGASIWRDEAVSYSVAQLSPARILDLTGHTDAVHAAYYLLLHTVFTVTGPSALALRLPSVLASVVCAGLVTAVARRLSGPRAALAAGLAWAAAPVVSLYAQEGRPYALVSLCVASAAYFLVRAVQAEYRIGRPHAARWWAAYAVAVAAAGTLNVLALLCVPALAVTVTAWRPSRAVVRCWALATTAGCLGVVPTMLRAFGQTSAVGWLTAPTWRTPLELAASFGGGRLAVVPVAALVLYGILGGRRRRADPGRGALTALALPLLTIPPAVLMLISLAHPLYQPRYVLYGMLGLSWLVGQGLDTAAARLPARPAVSTAAALLALVSLAALALPAQLRIREGDGHGDDLRALARVVAARAQPGDAVLFEPKAWRGTAFAYPDAFSDTTDVALEARFDPTDPDGRERDPSQVADALRGHRRVWVVSGPGQHRKPGSRDATLWHAVNSGYRLRQTWHVGVQAVRLYVTP